MSILSRLFGRTHPVRDQIVASTLGRVGYAATHYLTDARRDSVLPALEELLLRGVYDTSRVYGIRKDNPNLVNPADGKLIDPGDGKRADFSNQGLNFGLNVANLRLLQLLNTLKTNVPLP